jgi:hypothetical protein
MRKDFLMSGDRFYCIANRDPKKATPFQYIMADGVAIALDYNSPHKRLSRSEINDSSITSVYLDRHGRRYKYYNMLENIVPKFKAWNDIKDESYMLSFIADAVTTQMCNTRLPENKEDEEHMLTVFASTEMDRIIIRKFYR